MRLWLIWLLMLAPVSAQSLEGLTVVIDPGHGDRAWGRVAADPGATSGSHRECVYTWDTAMRLRKLLRERGAEVVLTLEDPAQNYEPHDRPEGFVFKRLVDFPNPRSPFQALVSRVATANRVFHTSRNRVYFFSLHYDSTSPRVAGVSFYYPSWTGRRPLHKTVRERTPRSTTPARQSVERSRSPGLFARSLRSVEPVPEPRFLSDRVR